jgi:tetratricopeptide (TPR) repeat protein
MVFGAFVVLRDVTRRSMTRDLPEPDLADVELEIATAVEQARAAVVADPRSAAAWGRYGSFLMAHEWFVEAAICFKHAGELEPGIARWPYLQGVCLGPRKPQEALACFQRAAGLGHDLVAPRFHASRILLSQGQIEEAGQELRRANELQPGCPPVLLELGRVALLQGQLDDALAYAIAADRTSPLRRDIHQLLCRIYQRRGEHQEMEKHLRLVENLPDDRAAYQWEDPLLEDLAPYKRGSRKVFADANTMINVGRPLEAIRLLEGYGGRDARDLKLVALLARAQITSGDLESALATLAHARRRDPSFVGTYCELGNLAMAAGRWNDAIEHYREMIRRQPNSTEAYARMGQCYRRLGQRDQAVAALESALRYDPRDLVVRRELALVLLESGRHKEAQAQLDDAALLAPDDPETARLLEMARANRPE